MAKELLCDIEVSRKWPARAVRAEHPLGAFVLRPTLMRDADQVLAAVEASRAELLGYMPWAHAKQGVREQLERLRAVEADYFAGRDMSMGLFRASDGALLAMIGLHARVSLNPSGLEVGYWCHSEHAGKGYTTFGVQVALVYAFDKLGADRVQVMCDETNLGSRRVIEKCGFVLEGVMRNATLRGTPEQIAGGYRATNMSPMFALVPETFDALPWVADLRARISYENIGGHVVG